MLRKAALPPPQHESHKLACVKVDVRCSERWSYEWKTIATYNWCEGYSLSRSCNKIWGLSLSIQQKAGSICLSWRMKMAAFHTVRKQGEMDGTEGEWGQKKRGKRHKKLWKMNDQWENKRWRKCQRTFTGVRIPWQPSSQKYLYVFENHVYIECQCFWTKGFWK